MTEAKIFAQFEPVVDGFTISKTFAAQIAVALNEVNRVAKGKTIEQAEGHP